MPDLTVCFTGRVHVYGSKVVGPRLVRDNTRQVHESLTRSFRCFLNEGKS